MARKKKKSQQHNEQQSGGDARDSPVENASEGTTPVPETAEDEPTQQQEAAPVPSDAAPTAAAEPAHSLEAFPRVDSPDNEPEVKPPQHTDEAPVEDVSRPVAVTPQAETSTESNDTPASPTKPADSEPIAPARTSAFKAAAPSAKLRERANFDALEEIYSEQGQMRRGDRKSMYGVRMDAHGKALAARHGAEPVALVLKPEDPKPAPTDPETPLESVTTGRARKAGRRLPSHLAAKQQQQQPQENEGENKEETPVKKQPSLDELRANMVDVDISTTAQAPTPSQPAVVPDAESSPQKSATPTLRVCVTDPVKVGDGLNAYTRYEVNTKADYEPAFAENHFFVHRRYREFDELHDSILRAHPTASLPPFPGKKVFGRFDPVFVEQRRQALQSYMQGAVDAFPTLPAVVRFLQDGAHPVTERQQPSPPPEQ